MSSSSSVLFPHTISVTADPIGTIGAFQDKNPLLEITLEFTQEGPMHSPMYTATYKMGFRVIGGGDASLNKTDAKRSAASRALDTLRREGYRT